VDPAPRKRSLGSSRHLCFGRARTVADASNLDVEHLAWADRDRCARDTAMPPGVVRSPSPPAAPRASTCTLSTPLGTVNSCSGPVYANAHVTAVLGLPAIRRQCGERGACKGKQADSNRSRQTEQPHHGTGRPAPRRTGCRCRMRLRAGGARRLMPELRLSQPFLDRCLLCFVHECRGHGLSLRWVAS
jgi:hypothetical protein